MICRSIVRCDAPMLDTGVGSPRRVWFPAGAQARARERLFDRSCHMGARPLSLVLSAAQRRPVTPAALAVPAAAR